MDDNFEIFFIQCTFTNDRKMRQFQDIFVLGWLTSVPHQPTRAYCNYCKKNLHAHRLSLLKHTCTMKHQRATLTYKMEEKKNSRKWDANALEVGLIEEVEVLCIVFSLIFTYRISHLSYLMDHPKNIYQENDF